MSETKFILSIDGGGMYGVVALEVCIAIEKKLGKKLIDIFDLFVGNSTGSLILTGALTPTTFGLESGAKIKNAEEILEMYFDIGLNQIFAPDSRNNNTFEVPFGPAIHLSSKLKQKPLKDAFVSVVGSGKKLSRINTRSTPLLAITTYNMSEAKPKLFRSWADEDKDINLEDALMASTSVPTIHPMFKIGGQHFVDGGVFAQDPAAYAIGEAFDLCERELGGFRKDSKLILVSIGTGTKTKRLDADANGDESELWWARKISSVLLDGQDESTVNILTKLSNNSAGRIQYYRFQVELEGISEKRGIETNESILKKAGEIMRKSIELGGNQFDNFNAMIGDIS